MWILNGICRYVINKYSANRANVAESLQRGSIKTETCWTIYSRYSSLTINVYINIYYRKSGQSVLLRNLK